MIAPVVAMRVGTAGTDGRSVTIVALVTVALDEVGGAATVVYVLEVATGALYREQIRGSVRCS